MMNKESVENQCFTISKMILYYFHIPKCPPQYFSQKVLYKTVISNVK